VLIDGNFVLVSQSEVLLSRDKGAVPENPNIDPSPPLVLRNRQMTTWYLWGFVE
jgi:hypothetical protein